MIATRKKSIRIPEEQISIELILKHYSSKLLCIFFTKCMGCWKTLNKFSYTCALLCSGQYKNLLKVVFTFQTFAQLIHALSPFRIIWLYNHMRKLNQILSHSDLKRNVSFKLQIQRLSCEFISRLHFRFFNVVMPLILSAS